MDLDQLAAGSAARYAGVALDKAMELALDAAPACIVHGDPVALAAMVDHLIDNAVKYGSAGGKILVLVRTKPPALGCHKYLTHALPLVRLYWPNQRVGQYSASATAAPASHTCQTKAAFPTSLPSTSSTYRCRM